MRILFSSLLLIYLGITTLHAQTVKDIDGNVYKTVIIGTQTWMAENLKTTKLNDGTAIPLSTMDGNEWADHTVAGLTTSEYGWLYDSAAVYKDIYGAFYNGYAITTGKLCPTGWHVPSDEEWTTMTDYLGGEAVAAGKIREPGTKHWNSPNSGATNETGFSARGGGGITDNGSNWSVRANTTFWSSTINEEIFLWVRLIYSSVPTIYRTYADMHVGNPVRCISDITGEATKSEAPSKTEKKQPELVTFGNEAFRFEITPPAGWLFSKIVQQDPYEEFKTGRYSATLSTVEGEAVPENWNGFRLSSTGSSEGRQPALIIYAHKVADQKPEEFIRLFDKSLTNFRVTDKTFNREFSVGDAKGFDCVYNLGVKVRYAALYKNGIRVVIQYTFPSNDPTLFEKYAPDVDKVIRSIVIL